MNKEDFLFKSLEHERALFIYRAQQRWTATRFSVTAFGLLATVTISLQKTGNLDSQAAFWAWGIAALFSILFWLLDFRNTELVNNCIQRLKRVEEGLTHNDVFFAGNFCRVARKKLLGYGNSFVKPYVKNFLGIMPLIYCCLLMTSLVGMFYNYRELKTGAADERRWVERFECSCCFSKNDSPNFHSRKLKK